MGMDLCGAQGVQSCSAWAWDMCLNRAVEFGWTPERTTLPNWEDMRSDSDFSIDELIARSADDGKWMGGYTSNDWQIVSDRDAHAMGKALLRAVAALSARSLARNEYPEEEDAVTKWLEEKLKTIEPSVADETPPWNLPHPLQEDLNNEIRFLREIANYALKRGFLIG